MPSPRLCGVRPRRPQVPGLARVTAAHNRITAPPGSGTSEASSQIASVLSDRSPQDALQLRLSLNLSAESGRCPDPVSQWTSAPAATRGARPASPRYGYDQGFTPIELLFKQR